MSGEVEQRSSAGEAGPLQCSDVPQGLLDELRTHAERLAARYHADTADPLWSLWQVMTMQTWTLPGGQPEVAADYRLLVRLVLDTCRWWAGETTGREDEDDVLDRGWVHIEDQGAVAELAGARPLARPSTSLWLH